MFWFLFDLVWVWFGWAWFGLVWCGVVWCGLVSGRMRKKNFF